MTTLDVPSLVVCRALKEVGWPQTPMTTPFWTEFTDAGPGGIARHSMGPERDLWHLEPGLPCECFPDAIAAPSLGLMFAECRRRGWRVELGQLKDGCVARITTGIVTQYRADADTPAAALGLAVAAAMKGAR